MNGLHLLLFAPLASTIGTPECVRPAPPPASLPAVADCDVLLGFITAIASMQRNVPLTWSRNPPALAGQKMPAVFSGGGNECEFVVDVVGGMEAEHEEDVFPTGDVVFIGRYIVQACLVGEAGTEGTVGSDIIGPRGVVKVRLRKKGVESAVGGTLGLWNGTVHDLNGTADARWMRVPERAEHASVMA